MTMFGRVAADTDPLAQTALRDPPALRPAGASADTSRSREQSGGVEAARYRAHRGYGTASSPFALMY